MLICILCVLGGVWVIVGIILMVTLVRSAPLSERWELRDLRAMGKARMLREEWQVSEEEVGTQVTVSNLAFRKDL